MSRHVWPPLFALIALLVSAACAAQRASPTPTPVPNRPNPASPAASQIAPTPQTNMPNPASVYCEQHGGRLDPRPDASGGVRGVCVFPNGSECDEWAYYRGACQPSAAPTATSELAADGWKVYHNDLLGYTLHYPAQASLGFADDPQKTLTIEGPASTEGWPTIFLSHPTDRQDYRPPAGVDLAQWLADHYLLQTGGAPTAEVRQPDVTIAGTTAIHTRLARSPQTYAYDKYFFAHSQQLFVLVILHAGDKEDWAVYNHFLASLEFG